MRSNRKELDNKIVTHIVELRFEIRRLREEGELRRRRIVELEKKIADWAQLVQTVEDRQARIAETFKKIERGTR
jgi:vacuolar-type H+-ATPase subunit I/STV1